MIDLFTGWDIVMGGIVKEAMWTHGHSIKIENSGTIKSIWRAGFFCRLVGQPGTTNWLHFAIPTPVIVDDLRLMGDSAMLRFRSGGRAVVTNVHVFDGDTRIAAYDGLSLAPSDFGFHRFDIPGRPDVLFGYGVTIGVRFDGADDASNTLEFAAAGVDFNLLQTVRMHFKVLTQPAISIDDMLASMREVYEPAGFRVVRASDETLNLPLLNVVDVGSCIMGSTTAEQNTLFANRNNVGANDIAIYFVQATNPPFNGCAAHPAGQPSAVVASIASRWTLGHEVGHVLGLAHINDNDRLMTGNGTANITNPPPDLISSEINIMTASAFSIPAPGGTA
jgi:hypothetical protein